MYAIRSYYVIRETGSRTCPVVNADNALHNANLSLTLIEDAALLDIRITSYNVCYTKLLRT